MRGKQEVDNKLVNISRYIYWDHLLSVIHLALISACIDKNNLKCLGKFLMAKRNARKKFVCICTAKYFHLS